MAKDVKTRQTDVDPHDYVAQLPWPRRVVHGQILLDLFAQVTQGEPAVMWGPSMVGYGKVHYASSSGREGDWFKVGFSPRQAKISLYGLQAAPNFEQIAPQLGKHQLGKGCLYINKLEDVDLDVLKELIRSAWSVEY